MTAAPEASSRYELAGNCPLQKLATELAIAWRRQLSLKELRLRMVAQTAMSQPELALSG